MHFLNEVIYFLSEVIYFLNEVIYFLNKESSAICAKNYIMGIVRKYTKITTHCKCRKHLLYYKYGLSLGEKETNILKDQQRSLLIFLQLRGPATALNRKFLHDLTTARHFKCFS
jgi:hypothetical protein